MTDAPAKRRCALQLENVYKRFGATPILRNETWQL